MAGIRVRGLTAARAMITDAHAGPKVEVDLDIIMRLLHGETVTAQTKTHTLINARLHLRPYTQPHFEVAVAAMVSPSGPRLAGTHGVSLLSLVFATIARG